ncbi:type II toxin-antitoxin system death-on-curing family toxin [Xanthomonas codiaei]|uniref:Type II toxin-antitoxin system death-on-curing family toxin n=1 Tax=Xanthomonas codiaei TaxID=56463 RepID=A0A2S7CNV2_9XANT|nr:type II toxin-antitoxin system death-on-curing family toxin [Xanthomonas codiaei]PPU63253.1 hypothetical protein XcodCFBP4690_12740 [Xanthomonas codiaei]
MAVKHLTFEEVVYIHDVLTEDFSSTSDPLSPPGMREDGRLLQSAIDRQHVGFGEKLKYEDSLDNAATLCFGVCRNHGFHNGNKRCALVSLLCHLDKNGFTVKGEVEQEELYKLMLRIASRHFAPKIATADSADVEVASISRWLKSRTRRTDKAERVITYRELRKILRRFNVELENPKGNFVDVVKYEWKRSFPIFGKLEWRGRRVDHIAYPRDGATVGKKIIRSIREKCKLDQDNGCDSANFYGNDIAVDQFIQKYKQTLKRLAKI